MKPDIKFIHKNFCESKEMQIKRKNILFMSKVIKKIGYVKIYTPVALEL